MGALPIEQIPRKAISCSTIIRDGIAAALPTQSWLCQYSIRRQVLGKRRRSGVAVMMGWKTVARVCAAAAMLCGAPCGAQAQTKPPAAAFAVLPTEPPQISPDGSRFALIRGINGRPTVAIYKVDAPQDPPQLFGSASLIVSGLRWVKNDVLLILDRANIKMGLFEKLRSTGSVAVVSLKDNKITRLPIPAQIVDIDLDDADMICVNFGGSLYRINVREGGHLQHLMEPPSGGENAIARGWILGGHGNVLARLDRRRNTSDPPSWRDTLNVLESGAWRTLGTYDATVDQGDGLAGITEDEHAFIRLAPDSAGTISVDRIDVTTGVETKLFQDPTYDVAGVLKDEWTGMIIGYAIDEDMPVYQYFDARRAALQKGLEQAFPGLSVHAVSTNLAGDKAIVEAVGPRTPASYYLYDRATHRATAVAASYPELNENDLGEVKRYAYTARDGMHIPAYLTLPPGRQPKNLPLVVIPHGGPDLRDDMAFDFISQFVANRGYAVLQPEFRGSRGYGRLFTTAGLHQWGLKMQDDISDGVKKMIADGIADPRRVCIFGGSYGGYAALAGATLTPELYACVASLSGPSNLRDMLSYSRKKFGVTAENFWVTRIGDDSAQLDAASPVLHADRVTAPVLLLHSELDVTVPIEQSETMESALQKAGKKVQFVRIEGDDHYLSLEQTRLRVLEELEKFLAANIGT